MVERHKQRRAFAVENMSSNAQNTIDDMLSSRNPRYTYEQIITAVREKTGEGIARSSLSRYYHERFKKRLEWEAEEQERRVQLAATILDVVRKLGDEDTAEFASRLIQAGLIAKASEIHEADPIKLLREERERLKLGLARDQLEVDKQKLDLMRRKLDQAAESIRKTTEEIAGRNLTDDEALKIREQVYGISDQN